MIVWMLFSVVIALIIAAAARAAEWFASVAGYRVRWIWAVAVALTLFLSAAAAVRGPEPVAAAVARSSIADLSDAADGSWRDMLSVRIDRFRSSLDAPLRRAAEALHRFESPKVSVFAVSLSLAASLGLVAVLAAVGHRLRRARREWPVLAMHGARVRVAPTTGPLVVGVVRPEIIVPRWLLARTGDEQRLVITHEHEHVRAHDPLMLAVTWAVVAITPWNPALWYMLSRLRLAIELDCDARVLARGAVPRAYGALLIDVAQHASALRWGALALADDASHLCQRILAMSPRAPRFARARAGLAAAVAIVGVAIACRATLPAVAEVEPIPVATPAGAVAAAARADVERGIPAADSSALETRRRSRATPGNTGRADVPRGPARPPATSKPVTPLILIDGVPSTMSALQALDRTRIVSVDVFKGPSAAEVYNDPEATRGVITVRTRPGGGTK